MSNRNFDHRVIIQRIQNKNYARNLYQNNYNGQGIINNPQNSDGTASRFNTFVPGAQTEYYRGLLGAGETVNVGGTFGIPPIVQSTAIVPPLPNYLEYNPNNPACYPGSGLSVYSVGNAGTMTGTLSTYGGSQNVQFGIGSGGISRNVFKFTLLGGGNIQFGQYDFTNQITINVWIYPYTQQNSPPAVIIANCPSGYPQTDGFKAMYNRYNAPGVIYWNMNFELGNGVLYEGLNCLTNDNIIVPNTWQFLSYVYDNSTRIATVYRNGTLITSCSGGPEIGVNNSNFFIGAMTDGLYGMSGELGYIKIYQGVLTAAQILNEYNSSKASFGLTAPQAPTINYIIPRNSQLDVIFTPGSDGGLPITNYLYSLNGASFISAGTTTSPIILSGLSNGTLYSVRIRAVNSIGPGAISNSVSGTPYEPLYLDYDPNNTSSYPGTGTGLTVSNAGTAGILVGTINGLNVPGGVYIVSGSGSISRNVFSFGLGGNISFPAYDFTNYMTINAWIYPYDAGQIPGNAINTIIANCPSGGPPSDGFKALINTYANINWTMNFELASAPGAFNQLVTPNNTLIPDTWQFLTYVLNNVNNTAQLYRNGSLINSYSGLTPNIVVSGQPFYIGQMTNNSFGLNGELGYIKIYDGILSGSEILSEFNASKASFGL